MPDSGFFYDELTDFNKEMMDLAEKSFRKNLLMNQK